MGREVYWEGGGEVYKDMEIYSRKKDNINMYSY